MRRFSLTLLLLCSAWAIGVIVSKPAMATTLMVNSVGDSPDPAPGDGLCAGDNGACTLRAAIMEANALPGVDLIGFSLVGASPFVVSLFTPLPEIIEPLAIDGSTQPGFSGTPLIVIDVAQAKPEAAGLTISAGGTTVRSIQIVGFLRDGIQLQGHGSNLIVGNIIGGSGTGNCARDALGYAIPRNSSPVFLGDFGAGGQLNEALDVNNCGEVVGNVQGHPFLWLPAPAYGLPAGLNDLHPALVAAFGAAGRAVAINDRGQVVGQHFAPGNAVHGFVGQNGQLIDIPPLPSASAPRIYPLDINANGEVVGWGHCAALPNHVCERAFVWRDGTITEIMPLEDCPDTPEGFHQSFSRALRINDQGTVLVVSGCPSAPVPALWRDGVTTDLATLIGEASAVTAIDLNNSGEVLVFVAADLAYYIVNYNTGERNLVNLPFSGLPLDLTDTGVVVGRMSTNLAGAGRGL